jgi:hypothetical protein
MPLRSVRVVPMRTTLPSSFSVRQVESSSRIAAFSSSESGTPPGGAILDSAPANTSSLCRDFISAMISWRSA